MPEATLSEVVAWALAEDVGEGDVTTAATVPEQARARALITQKAAGVVYGVDVAVEAFRALDPMSPSSDWLPRGDGGTTAGRSWRWRARRARSSPPSAPR